MLTVLEINKNCATVYQCVCLRTRQAANEPVELLFRDVSPGEIECDGLSLYDAS